MLARLLSLTTALVLACASAHTHANARLPQPETAHRAFATIEETASRAEALLIASDIKANCHRQRECTTAHDVYANNSPYKFTDPDGREAAEKFVEQHRKDMEAGNGKIYEPLQGPAVAVTAVMLVGPAAIAAALPEAGGAVVAESVVGETLALNAARGAAAAAGEAGATGGATTGLVTSSGEVFTGASANAGGPGIATNPVVRSMLDRLSPALRSCYHGGCGEVNAASNALNAGAKLDGAVMGTVRTVGMEVMEACPSCAQLAHRLGITTIAP